MRPLAIQSLAGAPEVVRGLSIIRGEPTPVIDLGGLLGSTGGGASTRFVTIRTGGRRAALSVDAVLGIRQLLSSALAEMPPLLSDTQAEVVEAIGMLDAELFLVLKAGRLVPDEVWKSISGQGA